MIISVNWLKKFTDINLSIDELVELIGSRLVEVEGVEDLGAKYKDVLIAKVISCEPIEGSDHLSLTRLDDGGKADVERDADGYVQVVCGAPNVRKGLTVAWLPPKSTVPETFGTDNPFVLGSKELRGHKSNGMIASAKELALYEDHDGILEIQDDAKPGSSFADLYELNDYLLDIENKSLTHRPDTFGIIGFAREVAGIQGKQFKTPEWLKELTPELPNDGSVETPIVTVDDPELSDRFQAVILSDVDEGAQSPIEIQSYLARSGIRPISAVVDVTNYMMLLAGRPLHAYDYDKLLKVSGGKADMHVRSARKGETLKLLDGKTLKLDEDDMVIAAGEVAVGLAGAMGGADTEIDSNTKRILLECATFNLYKLRAIQMRHGVFTEAITRLTKGLPGPLGAPVIAEAAKMMSQFSGAKVASVIADDYPGKHDQVVVKLDENVLNAKLGTHYTAADVKEILENVEFEVVVDGLDITVTVPYWRNDIHIAEDVMEEVGRLSGFDSINLTLPERSFTAVSPNTFDLLRAQVRQLLVRAGANEVLTYNFVHGDLMRKVGQNPDQAYRLVNSISPDLQYYRQSLTPSLLANVHPNIKAGYGHFALFEFNKFHTKIHGDTDENVPKELDSLALVVACKNHNDSGYYEAKRFMDFIAEKLGLDLVYEPLEADSDYPVTQPFEYRRSARIWDAATRERVGVIGEFKKSVQKAFKLPVHVAGFEISPRALEKLVALKESDYKPSSKYPGTERDVCFQVAADMPYAELFDATKKAIADSGLITSVSPIDIYQPESGDTKNITFRVSLASYNKTLTSDDASLAIDAIVSAVTSTLDAKVV